MGNRIYIEPPERKAIDPLERKARWLVSLVQGTMALEGQGLDADHLEELVQKTIVELKKQQKDNNESSD